MCEAKKTILAARGVCVNSDYGMAVGAFEPFATAAAVEPSDREWEAIHTWQHRVEGGCEALLSLRFAVFSRLSSADVVEAAALSANDLRQRHLAPCHGLLRARVSVTRSKTGASKKFIVGAGGIDVFASSRSCLRAIKSAATPAAEAETPISWESSITCTFSLRSLNL